MPISGAQLRQNMQAEGIDADIFLEGLSDPRPLPTQQELALSEQIYELYRRVLLSPGYGTGRC